MVCSGSYLLGWLGVSFGFVLFRVFCFGVGLVWVGFVCFGFALAGFGWDWCFFGWVGWVGFGSLLFGLVLVCLGLGVSWF